MITYLCPGSPERGQPSVGELYDHVELLRAGGLAARAIDTTQQAVEVVDDDLLVVPEHFGARLRSIAPGVRRVALVRDGHALWRNVELERHPFLDTPELQAVICTTVGAAEIVSYGLPSLPVPLLRVPSAFPSWAWPPFEEAPARRVIGIVCDEATTLATAVVGMLGGRGLLETWSTRVATGTPKERLGVIEAASVVLFLTRQPVIEPLLVSAMASGKLCVGLDVPDGAHLLDESCGFLAPAADALALATILEEVLVALDRDPAAFVERRRLAVAKVAARRSPGPGEQGLVETFRGLLEPPRGDRAAAAESAAPACERVLANRRQLALLEEEAAAAERSGDLAAALTWAGAAAEWAWFNHPGAFASPGLETLLARLGSRLLAPLPQWSARSDPGRRRVLHVLSEAYLVGGHTRLAWRWMEADGSSDHAVVLTAHRAGALPSQLTAAANLGLRDLTALDPVARVGALCSAMAEHDLVVLHIHPSDAVAVAACAVAAKRPPTILLNHADHVFWVGVGAADALAHIRPAAAQLSLARRGVTPDRLVELPCPLEARPRTRTSAEAKAEMGLPADAVVLFTMAAPYKYGALGAPSFAELVRPILERVPRTVLVAVGPGLMDPEFAGLALSFPGRVMPLGGLADPSLAQEAADIALDSHPLCSLTSLLETALYGVPAVMLPTLPRPLLTDDFAAQFAVATSPRAFIEGVVHLANDPEARHRAGGALAAELAAAHLPPGWNAWLDAAYGAVRHGAAAVPEAVREATDEIDQALPRVFGPRLDRPLAEVLVTRGLIGHLERVALTLQATR